MPPTTFSQVIETSIAAERAFEKFYRGLAEMFADDPEVAEYWLKYAREEAQHARWMEKAQARTTQAELDAPVDPQVAMMVRAVAGFSIEHSLQKVRTLEDAYQMATDFENSETNAIFSFVVGQVKMDATTADFLRKQLNEHISQLHSRLPADYQSQIKRQMTLAKPSTAIEPTTPPQP